MEEYVKNYIPNVICRGHPVSNLTVKCRGHPVSNLSIKKIPEVKLFLIF